MTKQPPSPQSSRTGWPATAFIFLAAVLLSVSACGAEPVEVEEEAVAGDEGDESIEDNDSVAAEEAEAQPPLRVGLIMAYTGQASEYGNQYIRGAELAVEVANKQGGANGAEIELIGEDSQGEAEQATSLIRRLAGNDVPIIVGPMRTAEAIPSDPIATEVKIPLLTGSVTPWNIDPGPYSFQPGMIESDAYPLILDAFINDAGVETAASLHAFDDEYTVLLGNNWQEAASQAGIEVVADEVFQQGDTDFAVQLTSIAQQAPDLIFIAGRVLEQASIMRQAEELGLDDVHFQVTAPDPSLGELSGYRSDGALTAAPFDLEYDSPKFKEFTDEWVDGERTLEELSVWVAYGYDFTMLAIEAARSAGSNTDSEAMREVLAEQTFSLALGDYAFDGSGPNLAQNFFLLAFDGDTIRPYDASLLN